MMTWKDLLKERKSVLGKTDPQKQHIEVGPLAQYQSIYELTLTTNVDDPYELRTALAKIVKSKMNGIVFWKACFELTKAGMPHIHAILYSSKKYLDATKIKQFFTKRYELKRVRSEQAFLTYIIKEKNNNVVINYCLQKGIPQIWDGSEKLQATE